MFHLSRGMTCHHVIAYLFIKQILMEFRGGASIVLGLAMKTGGEDFPGRDEGLEAKSEDPEWLRHSN
jgi:hypothetical protein